MQGEFQYGFASDGSWAGALEILGWEDTSQRRTSPHPTREKLVANELYTTVTIEYYNEKLSIWSIYIQLRPCPIENHGMSLCDGISDSWYFRPTTCIIQTLCKPGLFIPRLFSPPSPHPWSPLSYQEKHSTMTCTFIFDSPYPPSLAICETKHQTASDIGAGPHTTTMVPPL